jgi:hypothetical protein
MDAERFVDAISGRQTDLLSDIAGIVHKSALSGTCLGESQLFRGSAYSIRPYRKFPHGCCRKPILRERLDDAGNKPVGSAAFPSGRAGCAIAAVARDRKPVVEVDKMRAAVIRGEAGELLGRALEGHRQLRVCISTESALG